LTENVDMPERYVDILSWLSSGASDCLRWRGVPAFFRPDQLKDFGLTPNHLPALLRCGAVERVCRGLFHRADATAENYALAVACARCPDSIVCLQSALRVHGINGVKSQDTTAATTPIWLAIRHRARAPRLYDLPVRIVRFSAIAWSFRVIETEFDGVPARITTPARTVADCIRLGRVAGARTGIEAFNDAMARGLVTLAELGDIEWALPCRSLRELLALYDRDCVRRDRRGRRTSPPATNMALARPGCHEP
jgi:hypothetical protein